MRPVLHCWSNWNIIICWISAHQINSCKFHATSKLNFCTLWQLHKFIRVKIFQRSKIFHFWIPFCEKHSFCRKKIHYCGKVYNYPYFPISRIKIFSKTKMWFLTSHCVLIILGQNYKNKFYILMKNLSLLTNKWTNKQTNKQSN